MDNIMEFYHQLVPFLGAALGRNYEVALLDCKRGELVAIVNGHNSGREVGASITDLAQRIIDNREWERSDYLVNYTGIAPNQKLLRSSTYFIKAEGELLGMLCINVDTADYRKISELAMSLGGLHWDALGGQNEYETFLDSVSDAISKALRDLYGSNIPKTFSREERMAILRLLQERKTFLVKGSVPRVAQVLGCSEPTIYRNLSELAAMGVGES